MDLDSVTATRVRSAFPSSARADVEAVLSLVDLGQHEPTDHDIGPVLVRGEVLHIPMRIYFPEPRAEANVDLTSRARTILECLYTRHHDGHVREKYLRAVISSPLEWVPPFVVQLLGEYVMAIHLLIRQNIGCLSQESYSRFVAENAAFIELTKQRVVSYWDCYFRKSGSQLGEHAAYQVMKVLCGPRLAGQSRVAADGAAPRR
jgi:hypothetical protein